MMDNDTPLVQTLDGISLPPWGEVTLLRVHTADYKRLSWRQIWQAFSDNYPGRWAIEFSRRQRQASKMPMLTTSGCCLKGGVRQEQWPRR